MNEVHQQILRQRNEILQTWRKLHSLAEPSWKEKETSGFIREKLRDQGLPVQTYENHFGLTAEIKGRKPDVIALRADLDALVQEVNGTLRPNHSCGHDAHSTMVLHTALHLARCAGRLNHTIRFIFQPAEEKGQGALQMMKDRALDDVKLLVGIHLRPRSEIPFRQAAPVIIHGSAANLTGVIKGTPAHASRPEDGNNAIEAAACLIQTIRGIRLKSSHSHSVKITELHSGGNATNIIPDTARFTFDMRADTNEAMEELMEKALQAVEKTAEWTGTAIHSKVEDFLPAASFHPKAVDVAKNAIVSTLGEQNLVPVCRSPGGEDFHFYALKNPHIASTMIGLGCDLQPGLHHPDMTFNQEALTDGTEILTKMVLQADPLEW
ncbi:amidohydrolase [Melghirimyces profundicolus]|uniref:Amidohydrolase n=1 Tax=Melghirimyces profundicolus TaxID=1242148 RepID=A0A2T6BZ06_9BACL|nr:amidohydrolase [Melghirimyces profundicolus]PTX61300.1 amidohydrolase [Melghirimyces profundicolus]